MQSDFNASWTPLAKRYSLRLYREVGWETDSEVTCILSSVLVADWPWQRTATWLTCPVHTG
jgi:hypothetical protein